MLYAVFIGPTCFPLPVTLDGYFSSVGTAITSNKNVNLTTDNYLYSTTNNEIRRVSEVLSSTTFTIESAFTADVTDDEVFITDTSTVYEKISIANYGRVNGVFNDETMFARSIIEVDGDVKFTIDGTGTTGISILAE